MRRLRRILSPITLLIAGIGFTIGAMAGAKVFSADVDADNGVIHFSDQVIPPQS